MIEMNVGAKLVQEVAQKSDNKAGDGTTTSTLMTQEIVNQVCLDFTYCSPQFTFSPHFFSSRLISHHLILHDLIQRESVWSPLAQTLCL